ncbi:hypothetical protein JCM24511_02932 [Saitozyma sp. JCM 24511]|nr:hypothetical protein JCM24511_02932 [Saitozyma sp. JCM 24511]
MPSASAPTDDTTEFEVFSEAPDARYADTYYTIQRPYGLPPSEDSSAPAPCVIMPSVWVTVRQGDERSAPLSRPTKLSRKAICTALTQATAFSRARAEARGGTTTTSDLATDLNDAIRTDLSSEGLRGSLAWLPESERGGHRPVEVRAFNSSQFECPPFANFVLKIHELSNTDNEVVKAHLQSIWSSATPMTNGSSAGVDEDGIVFRRELTTEGSDSQAQRVTYVPV